MRTSAAEERHVAALAIVPQNTLAASANAIILAIRIAGGPIGQRLPHSGEPVECYVRARMWLIKLIQSDGWP